MIASILAAPASILIGALAFAFAAELACRWWDRKDSHWQARVWWEGETYTHRAKSEPEAREWASCYPVDAHVSIEHVFHGRPSFVAGRNVAV
ncbi:hypothetical protein VAC51_00014 [Variovorax phage VAC_51]|nr:hypothetical protein VAC51_00014 [Variovorax phage VAC_51]